MTCHQAQVTSVNTYTPSQRQADTRVPNHVWPSANTLLCTLHTRILKIDEYKCILTIVRHSHQSQLTLEHQTNTSLEHCLTGTHSVNPILLQSGFTARLRSRFTIRYGKSMLFALVLCTVATELKVCACRPAACSRASLFRITSWCREHSSTIASC